MSAAASQINFDGVQLVERTLAHSVAEFALTKSGQSVLIRD